MKPVHPGLQLSVATVLALMTGTVAADCAPLSPAVGLPAAALLLLLSGIGRWARVVGTATRRHHLLLLTLTAALLASVRWTLLQQSFRDGDLHQLARRGDATVVVDAVITSVPVESRQSTSRLDRRDDSHRRQTRFVARAATMHTIHGASPADGQLRVFVEGSAGKRVGRGDVRSPDREAPLAGTSGESRRVRLRRIPAEAALRRDALRGPSGSRAAGQPRRTAVNRILADPPAPRRPRRDR